MASMKRHLKVSGFLFNHVIQVTAQERGQWRLICRPRGEEIWQQSRELEVGVNPQNFKLRRLADEDQAEKRMMSVSQVCLCGELMPHIQSTGREK